jgi:YidC/Oxa1 family membrane protein insertase
VGLSSQYFSTAIKNESEILPEIDWTYLPTEKGKGTSFTKMTHTMLNKSSNFAVSYLAYAGPKGYDQLRNVDKAFAGLVDFGFFNTLAVWIYHLLQKIFEFTGNWGLAIIILTAIVRLLVMPFNVMSYKSMRVMSQIQPQVKAAQAKYKDDKVKANEEVMRLMKENKANPLGGCLPMLLQIPVFFALYRVLGQSVELYKAPFVFWITDLSAHDPFYVVPVLMTGTMYLQQKLTPSTMEPAQQRIMMFMLLGFSIFFITLPAGLTLYMFVSTLFGVLQQQYFLKDKKAAA